MNSFISLVFTMIVGIIFAFLFTFLGVESAKISFSEKGSFQYKEKKYLVTLVEKKDWIKVKDVDYTVGEFKVD